MKVNGIVKNLFNKEETDNVAYDYVIKRALNRNNKNGFISVELLPKVSLFRKIISMFLSEGKNFYVNVLVDDINKFQKGQEVSLDCENYLDPIDDILIANEKKELRNNGKN